MYDTAPYEQRPDDFHQCFEYVTHDTRCTETAIKGEYFCPKHRIAPSPIILHPDGGFRIEPLTDRDSIFRLASLVAERLAYNSIDIKRAGKILYACQLANSALDGKLRDQKLALQQQAAAPTTAKPAPQNLRRHPEPQAKDPCIFTTVAPESAPTHPEPVILSEARSAQSKDPDKSHPPLPPEPFSPKTPTQRQPPQVILSEAVRNANSEVEGPDTPPAPPLPPEPFNPEALNENSGQELTLAAVHTNWSPINAQTRWNPC